MVYTSYFASKKWNEKNGVCIALWAPKGYTGQSYPELFPPKHLLTGFKYGNINAKQYVAIYYKEVLNKLDPAKVYNDLNNKVLLCYERSGSFCHRNLIADWLRKHGYEAKEL